MIMNWRRGAVLSLSVLLLLGTGCGDFFPSQNSTQTLTVTPASALLKAAATSTTPGDSTTLSAASTTYGGTTSDVTASATWSSNAPTVVSVDQGLITAVGTAANSTATVTATYGGQSATCNVLLFTGPAPSVLTVNIPRGVTPTLLNPGQRVQLTASATLSGVTNTDISSYVTWSSNAPTIGSVDPVTGLVTAQAVVGNFTITATANLADNTTVTGQSVQFTVI
jgi:hypothetical protein